MFIVFVLYTWACVLTSDDTSAIYNDFYQKVPDLYKSTQHYQLFMAISWKIKLFGYVYLGGNLYFGRPF